MNCAFASKKRKKLKNYISFSVKRGAIMAKCAICEKAAHFGNNVSHSHRRSNKMWKSNVKSVKIKTAEGGARKTYVCTSCLRSGKVERA
jgi:large subunit ribosomal protein L28